MELTKKLKYFCLYPWEYAWAMCWKFESNTQNSHQFATYARSHSHSAKASDCHWPNTYSLCAYVPCVRGPHRSVHSITWCIAMTSSLLDQLPNTFLRSPRSIYWHACAYTHNVHKHARWEWLINRSHAAWILFSPAVRYAPKWIMNEAGGRRNDVFTCKHVSSWITY